MLIHNTIFTKAIQINAVHPKAFEPEKLIQENYPINICFKSSLRFFLF